jgi:tRNA(Ile2) C34 agmatinyltransferase TiaS
MQNVEYCVLDGISVIQAGLNDGLKQYFSDSKSDYVVIRQTLQAIDRPGIPVEEMLRGGKQGIITLPGMACW